MTLKLASIDEALGSITNLRNEQDALLRIIIGSYRKRLRVPGSGFGLLRAPPLARPPASRSVSA